MTVISNIDTLKRVNPCALNAQQVSVGQPEQYELDPQLVVRVRERLGYSPPGIKLPTEKSAEQGPSRLVEALTKAGISPFDPNSVKSYKRKVEKDWRRGRHRRCGVITKVIASVVSRLRLSAGGEDLFLPIMLAGLGAPTAFLVAAVLQVTKGNFFVALGLFSSALLFAGCYGIFLTISGYEWKRTILKHYRKPVPNFALLTALEVQTHHPGVECFIVEFERVDPFLLLHDPITKEEAYVEVWGEPSYRATRLK